MQCIGEAFGVSLDNEQDKKDYTLQPTTLPSIIDVFAQTQKKRTESRVSRVHGMEIRDVGFSLLLPSRRNKTRPRPKSSRRKVHLFLFSFSLPFRVRQSHADGEKV